MFSEIRKRLTRLYMTLTALFLIAFMIASYLGLKMVFFREQEQETILFAQEEALEYFAILKHPQLQETEPEIPELGGKMFFYVYNHNQNLVKSAEPDEELRLAVISIIKNWKLPLSETAQHFINTSKGTRMVMMASQGIYDASGQLLGVVYVGNEITTIYHILESYLMLISLTGLGFLILVYIVGNIMARKAMEPIYKSFERQRQFTANASHELRTPLTVIFSSTEAILADKDSSMSPFVTQTLLDMKDELQKINKLVANLLTLARVDAEVQKIYKESFDMVTIIKDVIHSLATLAAKKNIHITMETPDKLVVYLDKERMYQLVYILMDNAIKYTMDRGEIVLTASISGDQKFHFSIKDTGIGIAPEDQKRIFERFYRIDKARSRELGGTGLGLSIAKWIVDAHRGSIAVKSTIGAGTTFDVTINSTLEN